MNYIPVKYFNKIFDILLYEGFFILFFGLILLLLNDPVTDYLFPVSFALLTYASLLGLIGKIFHLFSKKDHSDDR